MMDFFVSHKESIPVKGYTRSAIYDLPRKKMEFIPNDLYELIIQNDSLSLKAIYSKYGSQNKKILDSYFNFLFEQEYAFLTTKAFAKSFPNIQPDWDYPGMITNAIIDFSCSKKNDVEKICRIIEDLGCRHISILLKNIRQLEWIYHCTLTSVFKSIEIWCEINEEIILNDMLNFLKNKEHRFYKINVISGINKTRISCPTSMVVITKHNPFVTYSKFKAKITNFIIDIDFFCESQKHNTFFNRKICIDKNGFIKNTLEQTNTWGSIFDNDMKKNISSNTFRKYWTVCKDKIQVCKDCEFRYMCVDNRIPIQIGVNKWTVLGECSYNPYIAKWADDAGYVPVDKCGTYRKETGFMPNEDKITKLNQKLWKG